MSVLIDVAVGKTYRFPEPDGRLVRCVAHKENFGCIECIFYGDEGCDRPDENKVVCTADSRKDKTYRHFVLVEEPVSDEMTPDEKLVAKYFVDSIRHLYEPEPKPPEPVIAVADVVAKVDEILRSFPEMAHSGRWRRIDQLLDWLPSPEPVAEASEPTPSAVERIAEEVPMALWLPKWRADAMANDQHDLATALNDAVRIMSGGKPEGPLWSNAAKLVERDQQICELRKTIDDAHEDVSRFAKERDKLRAENAQQAGDHRAINEARDAENEHFRNKLAETQSTANKLRDKVTVRNNQLREARAENELLRREKAARVYYQTIVYEVCNVLDALRGDGKIVCGTVEAPTSEVQVAMKRLQEQLAATEKSRDAWRDSRRKVAKAKRSSQLEYRKQLAETENRLIHKVTELEVCSDRANALHKQLQAIVNTPAVKKQGGTCDGERVERAINTLQSKNEQLEKQLADAEPYMRSCIAIDAIAELMGPDMQSYSPEAVVKWVGKLQGDNERIDDECTEAEKQLAATESRVRAECNVKFVVMVREEQPSDVDCNTGDQRIRVYKCGEREACDRLLARLELPVEPPTMGFAEAMEALEDGKWVKRPGWATWIKARDHGLIVWEGGNAWLMRLADPKATDWVEVESEEPGT